MLNNILKFESKKTPIEPTDNQLVHYRAYLQRMVNYLEFHATNNASQRSVDDVRTLHNAVVRTAYAAIIIEQLIAEDADQIAEEFELAAYVMRAKDLMDAAISEPTFSPVSIAKVVAFDQVLRNMIEHYYFAQVKRPWWKFWG